MSAVPGDVVTLVCQEVHNTLSEPLLRARLSHSLQRKAPRLACPFLGKRRYQLWIVCKANPYGREWQQPTAGSGPMDCGISIETICPVDSGFWYRGAARLQDCHVPKGKADVTVAEHIAWNSRVPWPD